MFDFTKRVKEIINTYAPEEARLLGHDYIGPEHILLGILRSVDSIAIRILQNLKVDLEEVPQKVAKLCAQGGVGVIPEHKANDLMQKVLTYSREEASKFRHAYVGSEHLLLALLRDPNTISARVLEDFGILYQDVRDELNTTLGVKNTLNIDIQKIEQVKSKKTSKSKHPFLDEFTEKISVRINEGRLDPVIGREKEIERMIQILSRKNKSNALLIGDAGVGKTAVVEGLALQIYHEEVPEGLLKKEIFVLDMATLLAGTKYRGEFEDRIKKIIKEVKDNHHVMLFIDEVHTIIGAGGAEGAVDAANILKPVLARGEVQVIAATTFKEYKRYIEKDSALERRFQLIHLEEPSLLDTLRILTGLKSSYEKFHHVTYPKETLVAAVKLSNRFITDRMLPDKAIDLLDEAAARVAVRNSVIPQDIKKDKENIEFLIQEKNEKVKLQEYEEAAKIRDAVKQMKSNIEARLEKWHASRKKEKIQVTVEDIASIVADWTQIPMENIQDDEFKQLANLESTLNEIVVGQELAISQLANSVKRARIGFRQQNKPIASFLFLGPTGVGKTELGKSLARVLFGDDSFLIRFDMSEYMEPHSISKLIGSPPGYVGYEEGGLLTDAVKRNPYSVVLFDEIEKAHRDLQNVLLQVLDEGQLTDNTGYQVDFRETIILLTSNIGAHHLMKKRVLGFENAQKNNVFQLQKQSVLSDLKSHFNPEFLNRLDDTIIFSPLEDKHIEKIVDIYLDEINVNLLEKDIYLSISTSAKKHLAKRGYDEKNGARPLRRTMQKELETKCADLFLSKTLKPGSKVLVSEKNSELIFTIKKMSNKVLEKLKEEFLLEREIDDIWNSFLEDTPREKSSKKESRTNKKVSSKV